MICYFLLFKPWKHTKSTLDKWFFFLCVLLKRACINFFNLREILYFPRPTHHISCICMKNINVRCSTKIHYKIMTVRLCIFDSLGEMTVNFPYYFFFFWFFLRFRFFFVLFVGPSTQVKETFAYTTIKMFLYKKITHN